MSEFKVNIVEGVAIAVVVALAIAAAAFVLSPTNPQGNTATQSGTSTQTQQATDVVGGNFAEHLLLFTSRNATAIVRQYQSDANVTWQQTSCLNGIYPVTGKGNLSQLLDVFFGTYGQGLVIGNVTRSMTTATNGSVIVNSTFGLVAQGFDGNLTASVTAQDSYTYSATSGTWLIAQETWHFLSFDTKGSVPYCIG